MSAAARTTYSGGSFEESLIFGTYDLCPERIFAGDDGLYDDSRNVRVDDLRQLRRQWFDATFHHPASGRSFHDRQLDAVLAGRRVSVPQCAVVETTGGEP